MNTIKIRDLVHSRLWRKGLPKVLRRYENADFAMQQRARFLYNLCFALIGSMILLILYTIYLQLTNPVYGKLYFPVLIPEFVIPFIVFACLILLIKGYFEIAAHFLLISALASAWIGIWMDRGDAVSRLDSILFVIGLLTMLPLLITKFRISIFIYIAANMAVLWVFISVFREQSALPDATVIDYLADSSIVFIFVGIVAYSTFLINNRSLAKAMNDINQRIEAEKALAESEKKFREMNELLPQTVFEADADGHITYVNQTGLSIFGYTKEDIQNGMNVLTVIHEADRERAAENFRLTMNGEVVEGNKYTAVRKDGTTTPVQIYSRGITENQQPKGIRGVVVDIAERMKAEKALKESELRYRTLFENAQIGIYQTTPDGKIMSANPALIGMLGFESLADIAKRNLETEDVFVDSLRTTFKQLMEEQGMVKGHESKWKRKDNEYITIIENATAVRDASGKIIYYDGFVENISERKKAEEDLKQSEQRYRTIIEAFPDIIMISDLEGNIIFGNEPFEMITGIAKADYKNLDRTARIHSDDLQMVANAIKELLTSGKRQTEIIENRFVDTWGNMHWLSGNISKITLNNQMVLQTISRDITEKKMIEKELEKHKNHLEQLVNERTEELRKTNEELKAANEELYYQRKELEEALAGLKKVQDKLVQSEKMASLGLLAAGVAHEINNPLNFIHGGAINIVDYVNENLMEHKDELSPLLEAIQIGVKRAADIVTSLNHYSRRDDLPITDCNVHAIIDHCLVLLNNQIKNRIEVIKEYIDIPFLIECSEGRLHQVFLNILANSVQAIADKGTIRIFTSLKNDRCIISIADTGCGIVPDILHKITDPFFTTKDPGKGTGLGLSITYNILKEYDGTIEFESQPGKGTKAIVTLPIIIPIKNE